MSNIIIQNNIFHNGNVIANSNAVISLGCGNVESSSVGGSILHTISREKALGSSRMIQQNEFDHIIMVLSVSGCTCECIQPSAELSVELHVVASVLVFFIECR